MMPSAVLMVLVTALMAACELVTAIPEFVARKSVHILTGVLCMGIVPTLPMKAFVCVFGAGTVYMNWQLKPFRFAKRRDVGMTVFAVVVVSWVLFELPWAWLRPMFFADPAAAIFGKLVQSPVWIYNKSVAGSVAAGVVAFFSLGHVVQLLPRLLLAAALALVEAVGGKYDNLALFLTLGAFHLAAARYGSPTVSWS